MKRASVAFLTAVLTGVLAKSLGEPGAANCASESPIVAEADGGFTEVQGTATTGDTLFGFVFLRSSHHGLPPTARDQQMEQDRAPALQSHLDELARTTTDQPPRACLTNSWGWCWDA